MSITYDLSGNDVIVNSIAVNSSTAGGTGAKMLFGNGSAPVSVTTTTSTYTAANMLSGIIVNSAATSVAATLDTAANVVAAIKAAYSTCNIGDTVIFELINGGSSSGAITVGAGTGGTFDANDPAANKAVAINTARTIFVRVTAVGTPAYVIYM